MKPAAKAARLKAIKAILSKSKRPAIKQNPDMEPSYQGAPPPPRGTYA